MWAAGMPCTAEVRSERRNHSPAATSTKAKAAPSADAHGRAEEALLDGIEHQQHPAERQRQPADPDGPARAELLLQRGRGCGRDCGRGPRRDLRRGSGGRLVRGGGALDLRLPGRRRLGAGRLRGRRLGRCRARTGNLRLQGPQPIQGLGEARLQRADAALRAERERDGDERNEQCQPIHGSRLHSADACIAARFCRSCPGILAQGLSERSRLSAGLVVLIDPVTGIIGVGVGPGRQGLV